MLCTCGTKNKKKNKSFFNNKNMKHKRHSISSVNRICDMNRPVE